MQRGIRSLGAQGALAPHRFVCVAYLISEGVGLPHELSVDENCGKKRDVVAVGKRKALVPELISQTSIVVAFVPGDVELLQDARRFRAAVGEVEISVIVAFKAGQKVDELGLRVGRASGR